MQRMNTKNRLFPFIPILFTLFSVSAIAGESDSYGRLLTKVAVQDGVYWDRFGAEEKKLLKETMDGLTKATPNTLATSNDQLAFWINAHNACVFHLISSRLPLSDVMKVEGFRDQLRCNIAGEERSLIDIESRVIRPLFNEPRVHFALWWGVLGSPRLAPTPYTGKNLDQQLDKQTKAFITWDEAVGINKEGSSISLSPLFDWYKYDFGQKESAVLAFVRKRVNQEDAKWIPKDFSTVTFTAFDWTLDQAKK